jgi:tetrathionate reductase subunit B
MARLAMVIDLRKCIGCEACTVACNAEWDVPPGHARTRVLPTPLEGTFPNLTAGFYVTQCNHCDEAPCLDACPSGATFRNDAGAVVVDAAQCIGCGYCAEACPYDARYVNPTTKQIDKCDFCAPRLARGQQPACVTTCPAHAKFFGDLEDPASDVARMVFREGARRIESPAARIGPNVFYVGRPEQVQRVAASFPPRAARLPASGELWRTWAKPLVLAAVGTTFLGQAVAFFAQLRHGEDDFDD